GADDDVVDVLREARGDGAAETLDAGAGLVAAHRREAAGEHHALAGELAGTAALGLRPDAGVEQAANLLAVWRLGQELVDRLADGLADVADFHEVRLARVEDLLDVAEMLGESARGGLADVSDREAVDQPVERRLLALLDPRQQVLG